MRVLTKSRFKLGLECPNKLFYTNKKEYANTKKEDPFLEAMAKGGFQVEELARMSYPKGKLLEENDWEYEKLWLLTQELLKKENVIIYEAAFLFDGLFIRTDILVKKGNTIELIEVKAKSFDPNDEFMFIGKKGKLKSEWKSYLFDVAFQKYVMQQCFPDWKMESFIMMADKSKTASIDGLNQLFRITKTADNRTGVKILANSIDDLGTPVLGLKNVSDIVQGIEDNMYTYDNGLFFVDAIQEFKKSYQNDAYRNWPTSYSACKHCEFRASEEEKDQELKSGFEACFTKQHQWTEREFKKPKIFDIGGLNYRKGINLFQKGKFFMDQLVPEDIGFKENPDRLSSTEHQWLQIEKEVQNDDSVFIDTNGLKAEVEKWVFPLHFIDFETSTAALPFHKGRHPYEQIAFQFSHHKFYQNGRIEHANEYLNSTAGEFPNFEFIRALKKALENDKGTIFRYANHENSIVNAIYEQLDNSNEADKKELMDFIEDISHSTKESNYDWTGKRDMVDLWVLIKNYYYNPLTKGSNSIKYVLPAILSISNFLQNKYSKSLQEIQLSSKNFSDNHIWLSMKGNTVINPYKMLPPVFENWTEDDIEMAISEIENINDGGAALTAYGKLQYTDMEQVEIDEIRKALLKYCELDTLAMIMIYEHFIELLNTN